MVWATQIDHGEALQLLGATPRCDSLAWLASWYLICVVVTQHWVVSASSTATEDAGQASILPASADLETAFRQSATNSDDAFLPSDGLGLQSLNLELGLRQETSDGRWVACANLEGIGSSEKAERKLLLNRAQSWISLDVDTGFAASLSHWAPLLP